MLVHRVAAVHCFLNRPFDLRCKIGPITAAHEPQNRDSWFDVGNPIFYGSRMVNFQL
jgi:hypothetical protein